MIIKFKAQEWFFDRPKVLAALDKGKVRAMSKIGAFVMRGARKLTNRSGGKGSSRPGEPPRKHTGVLRDRIFFAYDKDEQAVVIGPEKVGTGEAPAILEYGGERVIEEYSYSGDVWAQATPRRARDPRAKYRKRRAKYAARPYMKPALDKEIENKRLAEAWDNVVKP